MNISRKMSLLVTGCALLVTLPSLWGYYHYSKQALLDSTLREIQSQTLKTINNHQRFLQLASPNLKALSQLLNNEISKPLTKTNPSFTQRMMQFEDGAWRNASSAYNGNEQAGLFLPSDIKLTTEMKQFYVTALDVFDGFGTSATSNQILDNIWMLDHHRGKLVFDLSYPDFVYLMADNIDYISTPWMTLASPDNNAERTAQWTPALFDPVSESWMTSVTYPLDIDNEWRGTLGINISLNKIFSLLHSEAEEYQNEQHIIVDTQNKFIKTEPRQQELEGHAEVYELATAEQKLTRLLTHKLTNRVEILEPINLQGTEYQVIASKIEPIGWAYLRLIPTDGIYQPLQQSVLKTSLLIVVMTVLLGLLITIVVRKVMVKPLLQLAEQARDYALGLNPTEVAIEGQDELFELNDAFQSMHNKLTQDSEQLLQSELRYRQVVTNINEAIIQIDAQHCWQFLSPVWKRVSAYELDYCLNRNVNEFFHPADQQLLDHVVDLLLEGEQSSWHGEIRLKRLDHRYIWVNISLHISKEDPEQVINGTIENIHINYMTRAINQLVRTAEQMVISSSCSVATILEFLTEELKGITDLPLVWVKVCMDNQGQVLSHSGEKSDFLFENNSTWSGLHDEGSPVIACVREHQLVRVNPESQLPAIWHQRLDNDDIADSLFVPFYLAGGEVHAVIGFHAHIMNTFDLDFQQLMKDFSEDLRLICQMAEDQNLMRLHRTAVEKTANAIMITDYYGQIEWVNNAFTKQTLFSPDDVLGKKPTFLNSNIAESNQKIEQMWATIKAGDVWVGEIVNRKKDGHLITIY